MTRISQRTYDLMLADMEDQDPIYLPTPFWRHALEQIGEELLGDAVENFRNLPGPRRCFVPGYRSESLSVLGEEFVAETRKRAESVPLRLNKRTALLDALCSGHYMALSDYRAYSAGDDPSKPPKLSECSETSIGDPFEHFSFEGRIFSRSMLNYLNGLVFLKQHIDTSRLRTVLEIGGGFGSLGEILLNDPDRDYVYIDVDIPPAGYAASYYLSELYPEGTFLDYEQAKTRERISVEEPGFRAAVLAPWQLPKISGPFDLFVNFISFQEMELEVVENYADHVRRLECAHLLLRNLREGKAVRTDAEPWGVEHPITDADYDDLFLSRGYELVATNVHPYGFETVDGFHSELRLYRLG